MIVVVDVLFSTFDIVCYVFCYCRGNVCVKDFVYECVMIYCVKSLGHVQGYCNCSMWGLVLVETYSDFVIYYVECCGGGVERFVSVLVFNVRNVVCYVW